MTPTSSVFVSVVVPLRDDADIVAGFVGDLAAVLGEGYENYEVVLVDDGSTDATPQVVGELLQEHVAMRYLQLSRAFGDEVALQAGLDSVIGDVVVVMRPESDPPDLLPRFVEAARSSNGVVFGLRDSSTPESFAYRAGRRLFTTVLRRVLGIDLHPRATMFMAFSRATLNAVLQIKDKSRGLRIAGLHVGFRQHHVEYTPKLRRTPPRRRKLGEGVDRAISLIVTNSARPLRLAAYAGLLASLLNVAYIGYIFLVYVFKEKVAEGWVTLSLQQATMFLFGFVILTVLAEYVGRLLTESLDRPLYFVAAERKSNVMIPDAQRRNVVQESTQP